MDVKVSVIVPVYNVEPYLEECLSSLVHQTEPFYEVIVINDGSTDGSGSICEKYRAQYPNLYLHTQKNMGLSAARNAGMRLAAGDYIIFVDSDDYLRLDAHEQLQKHLSGENVEVLLYNGAIQCDIEFNVDRNAYIRPAILVGRLMTGLEYVKYTFPDRYEESVCLAAYQRAFLEKNAVSFPDGLYYEDSVFSLQVVSHAERIKGVSSELYVRRLRTDSITTGGLTEKKCRDRVKIQSLSWQWLAQSEPWQNEKALLRSYSRHFLISTLIFLDTYEDEILKERLKCELWRLFFKLCTPFFFDETMELREVYAFLDLLRGTPGIRAYGFACEEDYEALCRRTERHICVVLSRKLAVLSDRGKKVAVYGIGVHTERLLRMYQQSAGGIQCELCFLVSDGERGLFRGQPVYSLSSLPKDVDCVVISSRIYQEEMVENLLERGFEKKSILTLYESTDCFDLTLI